MRFQQLSCSLFFLFLFLLFSGEMQAQHVIEGRITDKEQKPVLYATVLLQNRADSSLVLSALSDTNGAYQLNAPKTASTILKISAPGYADSWQLITDTTANPLHFDFRLNNTARHLAGITVTNKKPLLQRKVDRMVYNVENCTAATGGDALEALKRAPGVQVNDNDVRIVGKSTVNVMINDKLLQVSGDELTNVLKSIPSENLARIEVITTPPAKYDAAGNAGLINIVLKKQMKNGLNGNATLTYTQRVSRAGSFNGNFNYRHDKLNVYGFYNAYRARNLPEQNITTQFTDQRWEQHTDAANNNVFNRGQIGADYNITPRAVIGFLYTLGNGGNEYYADALTTANGYNLHTGLIDSSTITRAIKQDRGIRNVGNLNYQWKADSGGRKVNIDLDYFTRTGKAKNQLNTNNYFGDGSFTGFSATSRTSGIQTNEISSAKIDVEWPTTFAQLTFGAKASFIHTTSDNLYEYMDLDSSYKVDYGKTNKFDYRENTQAIYGSAQRTMGKWELQAGLRGEYTQTKSYSETAGQTARTDYFKLFPTVFIQYKPNDNHAMNLNYSKRIDRPTFWDMNPFRTYYTATSYSQGNPFLQPSFSNNIEFGYTLKSNYSLSVYAQFVNNARTRVSMTDSATKSYSFNEANVGNVKNYGGNINITLSPFKWWECVLSGNAWYSVFSSDYYGGQYGASKPAFLVETNNTINLNKAKTVVFNANFSYTSKGLDDFELVHAYYTLTLGIRILLFDKRLTLACNGYDILRTERNHIENQYNGTVQDNYWDERNFRFSVGWKFGNSGIKAQRERAVNEDQQR